jgi:transposase
LGKKQGYMTLVLDLKSGAVVFTALGRKGEVLDPFWKRLKRFKTSILAVATDMGPAYIKAVRDNLPYATLVFDHFHIIKRFNEKLSKLRRDLHTQVESIEQKKVLKGTRWLLLKRADNLNEETDEKKRLEEALKLNAPLAAAYYLKGWIKRADASGVNMLMKFANKLATWRSCVLAYYDTGGLSTGPLEGVNNKVKTMKRMAYGYRDMEFFQLKIKALHESRYGLTG